MRGWRWLTGRSRLRAMKRILTVLSLSLALAACGGQPRGPSGPPLRPVANPGAVIAAEIGFSKLAQEKGWPTYSVPDGVGGRFSIFCDVGLTVAACVGFDIRAFLDGAKAMDKACQQDDLWQNPAMLNAALKFIASEKYGRDMEVMMPYGDYLKSVSE